MIARLLPPAALARPLFISFVSIQNNSRIDPAPIIGNERVHLFVAKPGIVARKPAVGRVIDGIEGLLATFDEGVGELDAHCTDFPIGAKFKAGFEWLNGFTSGQGGPIQTLANLFRQTCASVS